MKDEALKLALEALENIKNDPFKFDLKDDINKVTIAIKEALAQPEPEYLAFMDTPQRTWVGLTDEERNNIWDTIGNSDAHGDVDGWSGRDVMKAIEAKLKEKNT